MEWVERERRDGEGLVKEHEPMAHENARDGDSFRRGTRSSMTTVATARHCSKQEGLVVEKGSGTGFTDVESQDEQHCLSSSQ